MMDSKQTSNILSAFVLALVCSTAVDAQDFEQGSQNDDLSRARAQLMSLERDLDPMHMGLVDPLDALADQLIQIGQYERAHRTLDRAIQIVRVNQGLYTEAQFPYQRKKLLNTANSGNWVDAREQLEHLFWLYTKKAEYATLELMDDLAFMADVHLRGVSEDDPEYQAFHLRRGSRSSRLSLALGEALWGKENPLLVPMIYKAVVHLYLEKLATEQPGPTSRLLREPRGVDYMLLAYYEMGYDLLSKIKDIYAAVEPANPEALAMAQLYMADWEALFRQNQNALDNYKLAYNSLAEVTNDSSLMARFFEKPRLLPEPVFFPSLELAALDSSSSVIPSAIAEIDVEDKLVFSEWSTNFPFVRAPVTLPARGNSISDFAIFSFNISGAPELARLLRFNNPASIGAAENLSVLDSSESLAFDLRPKVRTLRFRPKLVDGIPQQVDATLVYFPAASF